MSRIGSVVICSLMSIPTGINAGMIIGNITSNGSSGLLLFNEAAVALCVAVIARNIKEIRRPENPKNICVERKNNG